MVKRKAQRRTRLIAAAEIAGRSLGQAVSAVDRLKARHPHPVTEVGEALAAGRKSLTGLTSRARARSTAVVKTTKTTAKKTRATLTRARRRSAKAIARMTRQSRKAKKQSQTLVRRARKTLSRSVRRFKR